MKTKIQNFLQVLTLHSVSFVIVFAVGFTALGAWNWSTRVSDGDVLTSEKWNAVIAQLEAVEQKADAAQSTANVANTKATTAQNTANAKVDKSYVDTKVSTASASLSCRDGFVWFPVYNICVQKSLNSSKYEAQAKQYCADTYQGRLISREEYVKTCEAEILNNTNQNEMIAISTGVVGGISCSTGGTSLNYGWSGLNGPFRCVY
jgi:hypothetical protein